MATALKLRIGPVDHGRPIPYEDFAAAEWQDGYQYELIDGILYVSPLANLPQGFVEDWIYSRLKEYMREHRQVINFVYNKCRVFVPGREDVTNPEPDLAAYHDFPVHRRIDDIRWEDVSPVLVVEIPSADDPDKDFVRNLELYLQVPSIREYWILDTRQSAERPTLIVYRRRGRRWQRPITVRYGETYTTRLLPGFELLIDPRR